MSRLIGEPGERWTLQRAVDALSESARLAGRPGWIWIAGFWYPCLILTNDVLSMFLALLGMSTDLHIANISVDLSPSRLFSVGSFSGLANGLALFPVMLLASRLIAGLAFVSGPSEWRRAEPRNARGTPRLTAVWRAGSGITVSTFGLWLSIQLITVAAVLALLGPVVLTINALGLQRLSLPLLAVVSPVALFLFAYVTVLQAMNQLALHSLACNRRGVVSALSHAWRLIRLSPWDTVRAGIADLLLSGVILVTLWIVTVGSCLTCLALPIVLPTLQIAVLGFGGVTRACFWARLYRDLGGLTPADRVPGLDTGPAPEATAPRDSDRDA